jgi:hypothetical protein
MVCLLDNIKGDFGQKGVRSKLAPFLNAKSPSRLRRAFVTRAGFKPTTACLEGRSSIQLSYRVNGRQK